MIKIFILAVIIALSAAAAWYLTPTQSEKYWYESVSIGVGFISCLLSIFVIYIAHTVEQHVFTKAALNDLRKLYKRAQKWDLSATSLTVNDRQYAQNIVNTALKGAKLQTFIKTKLTLCKTELDSSAPSGENILNYLDSIVEYMDHT